jgi:hypothetical protein
MENKTEIAWAAGFFDGEGHTGAMTVDGKHTRPYLRVQVGQIDRRVLDRFCAAVGAGKVGGPYGPYISHTSGKTPGTKPHYVFHAYREEGEKVLRILWPYLSDVKKEQAESVRSIAVVGPLKTECVGCGGPLDYITEGCDNCRWRHNARRMRGK